MKEIKIRLAKQQDALGIRKAQKASWLDTYVHIIPRETIRKQMHYSKRSIERMEKQIKDKDYHYWVAEQESKIIGYIGVRRKPQPEIKAIYVIKKVWGKGVGKKLISKALKWLGNNDIILWVEADNNRAIAFYKKYGFKKTRRTGAFEVFGYQMAIIMMRRKVNVPLAEK